MPAMTYYEQSGSVTSYPAIVPPHRVWCADETINRRPIAATACTVSQSASLTSSECYGVTTVPPELKSKSPSLARYLNIQARAPIFPNDVKSPSHIIFSQTTSVEHSYSISQSRTRDNNNNYVM